MSMQMTLILVLFDLHFIEMFHNVYNALKKITVRM